MRKKDKRVYGIGVNDSPTPVSTKVNGKVEVCPFYRCWKGMLERCYSPKNHIRYHTYIGCSVSDDWIYFSNFKSWMEQQDWKGKSLDKDLLVGGNKLYSPKTCLFVTEQINSSILLSGNNRGEYPLGCYYDKSKRSYQSNCNDGKGNTIKLGCCKTPIEAHRAWQLYKIKVIGGLKDSQTDRLVRFGLQRIINKVKNDYDNNKETKDFN